MNLEEFGTKITKLRKNFKFSWQVKIRLDESLEEIRRYLKQYILENQDLKNANLTTLIYCIEHGLASLPKCPRCGHEWKSVPIEHNPEKLCGNCSRGDKNRISKAQDTIKKHGGYNVIVRKARITRQKKQEEDPNYSKNIVKKSKATKLERYGDENYTNSEQRKRTNLERYGYENAILNEDVRKKSVETLRKTLGVDNPFKSEIIKKKIAETNLSKRGVKAPMQSAEVREKARKTKLERYNDETYTNPEKGAETKLKRYGDKFYSNREKCKKTISKFSKEKKESIVEKIKATKLERYGDENYCNTKKIAETTLKHLGVDSSFKSSTVREKAKETYKKRTGFDNPFKNPKVIELRKKNYFRKTGFYAPGQNPAIRKIQQQKYKFQGICFGSSWEFAFYIWLNDNGIEFEYQPNIALEYFYNGVKHFYHPDFKIGNKLIEIKGDQFFNEDGTMRNPYSSDKDAIFEVKRQCMIDNDVKILRRKDLNECFDYIDNKYGKGYLQTFKNRKEQKICQKNDL